MNKSSAISFCRKYRKKKFYQPVIFVPGVIEIQGKWHEATKLLAHEILNNCSGKSILDLGCMHGFFLHEAKKCGAGASVGVDYDIAEISIAREVNEIFDDGVEIVHEDLEQYNPSQNFDIVLMLNILHVLKTPHKTIDRYLNNYGQLIIEHEEKHEVHFPLKPHTSYESPRSARYRKVSIF